MATTTFLRTIRQNALTDAVTHGQIGSEAEDFADRVLAVAAETMAELDRLDRERDAMLHRGDGR